MPIQMRKLAAAATLRTSSVLVLSLILATTGRLPAQQTEAAISGLIVDSQGAAISGARAAAVHLDTGVKTTTHSNETGFYSLRPLPIGPYTVTVEQPGFRSVHRAGIVLSTGQALDLNFSLEPGVVSDSITVTDEPPILEARSPGVTQLIETKNIEELPLFDRGAYNVVEITGAAVFSRSETGTLPAYSLAGGRVNSQMIWIDGGAGQNMRLGQASADFNPPIEALQEVRIMANGFSAEFGASAGGVVVAHTKSGGNTFKGSLYEYFRNDALDAPNFFSPIVDGSKQRPSLRYNVFGGTAGGPIRRDRTFFFFSYQGSRRNDGGVRTLTVPTVLERAGDFSQTFNARGLAVVYEPASSRQVGNAVLRDPVPGNRIPAGRIDGVAGRLVPFFPLPNRPPDGIAGANNFRQNDVNRGRLWNFIVKLDHNLSSRNRITVRYLMRDNNNVSSSVYPNPAADTVNQTANDGRYWYGAWTGIVSPNIINELRLTSGSKSSFFYARGAGEGSPSKLGLTGVSDDFFPRIEPAGYAFLGSAAQDRIQSPTRQVQLVESLSWVRGRQSIKIGGEIRPSFNRDVNRPTVSGRYVFSRGFSGLPGNTLTGNGFATLLLGTPTNFTTQETDVLDRRSWYHAWFAQSDWTVSRSLTVNLGVRWEVDTPLSDTNNLINGFDPIAINPVSGTPGVVRFLGQKGFHQPYGADWNNFGPRVGFAWRPFGLQKTVVRAGYGAFFANPAGGVNTASLGFERSAVLVLPDNNLGVPYTMGGGIPAPPDRRPLNDSYGAVPLGSQATTAVTYYEPNRRTGYSQQVTARIQHELPGQMAVEYGYIGNLSRKLPGENLATNQIPPSILGPGRDTQRFRPYPQFGGVTILSPGLGVGSYHAGLVKLERRFARGYNILATYTWSKTLDNSSSGGAAFGDEGSAYSNYYDRRADWGPSEIDLRHRLTWSSVWHLPVGKGRAWLAHHWTSPILSRWSLSGVLILQTGFPVTVTTLTNSTNAFPSGAQRADILRNPNLPASGRGLARWFDTGAFRQPAPYTFGNQGIGHVRADGRTTLNCSILRTFVPREKTELQLRADFFNAPNHPDFETPGRVFEGPAFGIVSSAWAGRQVQLGLKLSF